MRILAAGDTWGISGPAFLGSYAALIAVAIIATVRLRRFLARSLAPASRLTAPDEIAYLHGGPDLTVLTALSAMHVAGLIASSGQRHVQAVGDLGPDASDLQRAIHRAAQQRVSHEELAGAAPVAAALERIHRRLTDGGLLLSAQQYQRIRRTGWVLEAVIGVGTLRAVAGIMADKPIGFLLLLLAAAGVGATVLRHTAPRRTDRGEAELSRLRDAHVHLSPRSRPDWAVYGPTGAALGVALFGASALWAAEPAFAVELGAGRMQLAGDPGDGCGDGCGGGCGCGGCGE